MDLKQPSDCSPHMATRALPSLGAVRTNILHFQRELPSRTDAPIALEELSAGGNRPMIMSMPTTVRPQQRYDHCNRRQGGVTRTFVTERSQINGLHRGSSILGFGWFSTLGAGCPG